MRLVDAAAGLWPARFLSCAAGAVAVDKSARTLNQNGLATR
jgi:hypothetical protein